MNVGFTGTQKGMTVKQAAGVTALLKLFRAATTDTPQFHFGWCIGADDEAAMIAGNLGYTLIAHPGNDRSKRGGIAPSVALGECPNLTRNGNIVHMTNVLIAAPLLNQEEQRSGTWSTVRRARKALRPIFTVWPSGRIEGEGPDSDLFAADLYGEER